MKDLIYIAVLISLTNNVSGESSDRITGAKKSQQGQFPYFVQCILTFKFTQGVVEAEHCGASLIHPLWLLTAGHCFKKETMISHKMFKQNYVQAFMGSHKAVEQLTDPDFQMRPVKSVRIHPYYTYRKTNRSEIITHDIALALLKHKFPLNDDIETIRLADKRGHLCSIGTIVGAGLVNSTSHPKYVQYVKITTKSIHQLSVKPFTHRSAFYSEVKIFQGHHMQGDSGGPFVCYEDSVPIQYGVISIHYFTEYGTVISVYELVQNYKRFIKMHVPTDIDDDSWKSRTPGKKHKSNLQTTSSSAQRRSLFILACICIILNIACEVQN